MAIKAVRRSPAAGGPPIDFHSYPSANQIYVDGLTDQLTYSTGTSGSASKVVLDNLTSGLATTTPLVLSATAANGGAPPGVQGGAVTSTLLVRTFTAIANNVATATLTVTIPNAAQSATLALVLNAIAGAGGAVGAGESAVTGYAQVVVARTPGVATVATAAAITNTATSTVAGGNAITLAYAVSAIAGAVGVTQTFTINVTINAAVGAATNHVLLLEATLLNWAASGVTIA